MALTIFNVVLSANVTSTRFFFPWTGGNIAAGLNVPVTDFVDDTGTAATAFPAITNGYYNFYINGVLQESGNSSISTTALTIHTASSGPIAANTPFVVEFVQLS
ncbi:hypothetical protein C2W64_01621 [Brevibacillus laterosporus]|nr:DUF4183 domain-containing protein [Brevibacillus laterosporus]RAP30425.1 hypothetical protein C2W64_01621 [Brevibacillus laterosporus]